MSKLKILELLLFFLFLSWSAQGKKHLIANNPDSVLAVDYLDLGTDCRNKGLINDAERYYQKAISTYPAYALLYVVLGNLYGVEFKDLERAKLFYQKAIDMQTDCTWAYVLMGDYYLQTYLSKHEEKNLELIRQYSKEAIALNPRISVCVYNNIGLSFQHENNCDSAEYYFKKGIELWPKDPYSYTNLANLYNFQANDIYFNKPTK